MYCFLLILSQYVGVQFILNNRQEAYKPKQQQYERPPQLSSPESIRMWIRHENNLSSNYGKHSRKAICKDAWL